MDVNTRRPTVTLHVVSSLDGFIARNDNSVSWLDNPGDAYEAGVTQNSAEIEKVLESIDCYVLGSRTYEHALELGWPYGDKPTVVVSTRDLQPARKNVELYSGDLKRLVEEVLAPRYGSIWLVGGAKLCQDFLSLNLVDKIILTIAPVTLGGGLRLFGATDRQKRWRLTDVAAHKNGFVELSYEIASTDEQAPKDQRATSRSR